MDWRTVCITPPSRRHSSPENTSLSAIVDLCGGLFPLLVLPATPVSLLHLLTRDHNFMAAPNKAHLCF